MAWVTVTESAGRRIQELLTKQGSEQAGLRVRLTSGGCAGFQYRMELAEAPGEKDFVVAAHGVKVFLDPKSAVYLAGSELDFVTGDLMGGRFEIRNPQAEAGCSCGNSFTLRR